MNPTIAPTMMIITGSSIEVRAFTTAATSSS